MLETTRRNINIPMVLKVLGYLLMIEAVFMLVPMCVSFSYIDYPEEQQCGMAFLYSAIITFACAAAMTFGIRTKNNRMKRREGFLLTAVVWIFFSAFSTLPFLFSGVFNNVTDAFFESMSGFTTTGSSVIVDITKVPYGILFWRSMSQWLGGMGIILFTLAVVPMLNTKGGIAMFNAEVTGITHERFHPRVSQTAITLWGMYFGLTIILAVLLLLGPMDPFEAVCRTMSTVSTGGFGTSTPFDESDTYSASMVLLFMFLCGINFTLLLSAARGNFKPLRKSDSFKWYVLAITITAALIVNRVLYQQPESQWDECTFGALFDTVSAITSTGFSTFDYQDDYGPYISFVLMCAMFFGAMTGSTAGGAKIDRIIVLVKNMHNEFYKVLHPNTVTVVHIEGRSLSRDLVSKTLAFLSMYVLVMVGVALLLTLLEGQQGKTPVLDAFFTSMSAISNVGYGHGITYDNWALLNPIGKWMLAFEMMVGRLEVFTVLVLFTKSFWVRD